MPFFSSGKGTGQSCGEMDQSKKVLAMGQGFPFQQDTARPTVKWFRLGGHSILHLELSTLLRQILNPCHVQSEKLVK